MYFPTVTETQMEWMCKTSLGDFCEGKESNEYLDLSKKVIQTLGYVHEDNTLAMDHNALTMVWEMHDYMPEAIHLCAVLEQLYLRFSYQKSKTFKESDSTQNEFLSDPRIGIGEDYLDDDREQAMKKLSTAKMVKDNLTKAQQDGLREAAALGGK